MNKLCFTVKTQTTADLWIAVYHAAAIIMFTERSTGTMSAVSLRLPTIVRSKPLDICNNHIEYMILYNTNLDSCHLIFKLNCMILKRHSYSLKLMFIMAFNFSIYAKKLFTKNGCYYNIFAQDESWND